VANLFIRTKAADAFSLVRHWCHGWELGIRIWELGTGNLGIDVNCD